jgi:hypothetical protein
MRVLKLLVAAVMVAALGFVLQPAEAQKERISCRASQCGEWVIESDTRTNLFDDTWTTVVRLRLLSRNPIGGETPQPTAGRPIDLFCITNSDGNSRIDAQIRWGSTLPPGGEDPAWGYRFSLLFRFDKSPPQTFVARANFREPEKNEMNPWYDTHGISLLDDLRFVRRLQVTKQLVGQASDIFVCGGCETVKITLAWDLTGLDAALKHVAPCLP